MARGSCMLLELYFLNQEIHVLFLLLLFQTLDIFKISFSPVHSTIYKMSFLCDFHVLM